MKKLIPIAVAAAVALAAPAAGFVAGEVAGRHHADAATSAVIAALPTTSPKLRLAQYPHVGTRFFDKVQIALGDAEKPPAAIRVTKYCVAEPLISNPSRALWICPETASRLSQKEGTDR